MLVRWIGMRALLAMLVLLGCDAGAPNKLPPPKPAPPTPPPAPVVVDAASAEPPVPHIIDWELGGLGSWKGNVVGGMMWHVAIDLEHATFAFTDPGGVSRQRHLSEDAVASYRKLAQAVRDEPHAPARNSCTDRRETLRVDALVLGDSCPLSDRGAAALVAAISRELPNANE